MIVSATNSRICVLLWVLSSFLLGGCTPNTAAPEPLSAEQIPAEMQRAFAKADSTTKELLNKMLGSLQSKDYPAAYQEGQSICGTAGITKNQLQMTARAMLGINALLQNASAQGDESASTFIEYQKHSH